MMRKLRQLLTTFKLPKKFYKLALAILIVVIIMGAITALSNYAVIKPADIIRTQANDFVVDYGTYDATTYDMQVAKLQPNLTAQLNEESFNSVAVAQKRLALAEAGLSIATFPTGKNPDIEVTMNGDSATAKVFAIESQIGRDGVQSDQAVDYTLTYKKIDKKWLVDAITAYRSEEQ